MVAPEMVVNVVPPFNELNHTYSIVPPEPPLGNAMLTILAGSKLVPQALSLLPIDPAFVGFFVMVNVNVAVFTQPAVFNEVNVYVPLTVYVTLFAAHVYESHEDVVRLPFVVLLLIVRFNVAVFTQPLAPIVVFVYTPEVVYVNPLAVQVYELQAVIEVDVFELLLMVNTNVAVFTQPAVFKVVYVYVPLAVYVVPFHK